MSIDRYQKLNEYIREQKALCGALLFCNRIITALVFLSYPVLLVWLFLKERNLLLPEIIVPAAGFVSLSVFRYFVNAKRPYEYEGVENIANKKTEGKSFPSRHVFSAVMIANALMPVCRPAGLIVLLLAAVLGVLRVLLGVHFVRDVLVGTVWAAVFGAFLIVYSSML